MTLWDLEAVARSGIVLRRSGWSTDPATFRSMRFVAGAGSDRAVALFRVGTTERPIQAGDLGEADWRADDWRVV